MSWVQRRQPPRRRGQNRGTRGGESGLRPAPQRGHERDAQTFDGLLGESSQVPAVLFEAAFISNPEEEQKLVEESFQDNVAQAVYTGLMRFLAVYGKN